MKRLIIINGVTGAIGTACLTQFFQTSWWRRLFMRSCKWFRVEALTVYGLSRKALPFGAYLLGGKLPEVTLICSVQDDFCGLVGSINFSNYQEVVYIHALGLYPFETNGVQNDHDGDGINDEVTKLTYETFFAAVEALQPHTPRLKAVIFGSLADKHRPSVHQSWWKTILKVKAKARDLCEQCAGLGITVLNISSVICPHELLTRPFVFTNTDAEPIYWLSPREVAEKVVQLTKRNRLGFLECDLYHKADYFHEKYFMEQPFTFRKKLELGLVK